MRTSQIFAYQPILDATLTPVAVELICADRNTPDGVRTAADVVLNAFIHAAPDALPRRRLTYLAAPVPLLSGGLLDHLPPEHFALEVQGDDLAAAGERYTELKQAGYQLVLDSSGNIAGDATIDAEFLRSQLPILDVIRINGEAALREEIAMLSELHASGVRLLADHVDHREMLPGLQSLGFTLFQGYHFARPTRIEVARADPRKLAVLDLLAKLASDKNDPVIEDAFKTNPALSLQLLRIVNSSAFALKTRIRSIKHAFAILGRKQLERWLQILLFSFDGDDAPSPLMELALRRARFMEFVLMYRTHQDSTAIQDEAYMTGLLSLVDLLLGWSMQECVERLNLADDIRRALLHRAGSLGHLLDLCVALENADFTTALPIAERLHLPLEAVMTAQSVALSYSERIGQETPAAHDQAQNPEGAN